MGWGDEVVAAGQAQRLYDADPSRRVAICGLDGMPRWHPIWDGNPIIARPEELWPVAKSGKEHDVWRIQNGPECRPYIVYPFTKETGWTFNQTFRCRDHIARIYLTPDEIEIGKAARARYGPYVLIEPYTKHSNFAWPLERWEWLVQACPELTFVQHVHADSQRVTGAQYERATFRQACGLIAASDAYVRSESGLCHAAAALGVPQVTLFGGCMDWTVMGGYPFQTVIFDNGEGSPCGCWKPCAHCRRAMGRISVKQVIAALGRSLQARRAA